MQTFISYSRQDELIVSAIAADLRRARVTVWLDQDLSGGSNWWQTILKQIREADIFILALSQWSQRSKPCQAELSYARALGMPVIPVRVGSVDGSRGSAVADLHIVDYQQRDAEAVLALLSAVQYMTPQRAPRPQPLPDPPPMPFGYLLNLRHTVDAPELSPSQQIGVLAQFDDWLVTEVDQGARHELAQLLMIMRERSDVTYRSVIKIDKFLAAISIGNRLGTEQASQSGKVTIPAPTRTASTHTPSGPESRLSLRFYWVLDVSGSMAGPKIAALNYAIREALPAMKATAHNNPHTEVEVRAMTFGTGYKWMTPALVPLEHFNWSDVSINGVTDMGAAMKAMALELSTQNMPEQSPPPVVVLVTDGQPTDDFASGLQALLAEPWGKRAVRIAIAIGDDADRGVLNRFIGHPEMEPMAAQNAADLVRYIRWATTTVLRAAFTPAGSNENAISSGASPSLAPAPLRNTDSNDEW